MERNQRGSLTSGNGTAINAGPLAEKFGILVFALTLRYVFTVVVLLYRVWLIILHGIATQPGATCVRFWRIVSIATLVALTLRIVRYNLFLIWTRIVTV